ncbi:MAG: murein L,D-transpeptidase catalytic domain family protein [Legionellaceae bacterium]|nr:murein L,D-transpeptidase catalytic domain family protein [Legionellaceae bacterium]
MKSILHYVAAALLSFAPHHQYSSVKHAINVPQELQILSHSAPRINKNMLKMALTAYNKASLKGKVKKPILTVIDYSLPSNRQRMWVFDMKKETLLFNTYVAHGVNSGLDVPHHFSNVFSSRATSLGAFITADTYNGSKGYSLNLKGLEPGFNDHAYDRRVVIHGAWYVEPTFIQKSGRAGRSWGCPAIAPALVKPVINTIKNGSLVFAYYPDSQYLHQSHFATA